MKILVDTTYIHQLVYRMLRDLDDGKYKTNSSVCCGMLSAEQTAALEDVISQLTSVAK